MDIIAPAESPDSSFVPESCTLPTVEQPLRVAEFAELFVSAVRAVVRSGPTSLRLVLDGDRATEAAVRELVARETECCSFFSFTFEPVSAEAPAETLQLTVAVPAARVAVLDGLHRLAETAIRSQEPA